MLNASRTRQAQYKVCRQAPFWSKIDLLNLSKLDESGLRNQVLYFDRIIF